MAKDKERSVNPAQQQRKLEKAKALKKSRAELQARRNEKLARRNPDRIQRQIDDLKALETSGDIKPRERAILDELERDLRAVRKARDALGETGPAQHQQQSHDRRPQHNQRGGDNKENNPNDTVLGKRRHDGERKFRRHSQSGSDTDESVRRIPMPEDTPPPAPRQHHQRYHNQPLQQQQQRQEEQAGPPTRPAPSTMEIKTTYESAPQLRNLKKEAVSRFVPNVVRQKRDAVQGVGGQLLEPEELDRLEAAGYSQNRQQQAEDKQAAGDSSRGNISKVLKETTNDGDNGDADDNVDEETRRLAEEEAQFQRELAMQDDDKSELDNNAEDDRGIADTMRLPQSSGQQAVTNRPRPVQIEEIEDEDG